MRWLWWLLLAAVALAAVGAELDRASAVRPQLSVFVPRPFRSFAQSPTAMIALASGEKGDALAEARRLVARRPLPAEHLFALALAELRSGHPRAFERAFRAASTRGWRYPPLQVTAAQGALASGDVRGAANRIAALWAADASNPLLPRLTAALLTAPGGPEAFSTPLSRTHVWSGNFISGAAAIGPAPAVARTVRLAQRAGGQFDCGALRTLSDQLTARAGASARLPACN